MRLAGVPLIALMLLTAAPALAVDGADLYAKNCASCHGPDARAATPAATAMKVPAIAGHDAAATVEFVKADGKHAAPAAKLSDEELQAIGAFLASQ